MKTGSLICGLTAAIGVASAALAHTGASGVVKQRMDAMGAMAEASKALAAIVAGQAPYDAGRIREQARRLGQHSGRALTALFPNGSIQGPSEAVPAIWQDWARFGALSDRLAVLAEGLDRAAENGLGGVIPVPAGATAKTVAELPVDTVFAAIAQTCKSCHADFRVQK